MRRLPLRRAARRQVLPPGGYRSFAWPDERSDGIVTNPLEPGGAETSNRGAYLRFPAAASSASPGRAATSAPAAPSPRWTPAGCRAPSRSTAATRRSASTPGRSRCGRPSPTSPRRPGAPPAAAPPGAGGRRRRRRPPLAAGPRLAAGVPALLQRQRQQGDPAGRRLAGTGGGRTRSATSARCGMWNAADSLWVPDPGCRSASKATWWTSPSTRPIPTAATRWARAASCSPTARAGSPTRCRPDSPAPTSPRSPLPAARRSSPRAATSSSTTAAAGGSTPPPTPCSTASAAATRSSMPWPACPTAAPSPPGATSSSSATAPARRGASPTSRSPASTAIAAAAVRDGGQVRAILSVVPRLSYPPADDLPEPDPNVPPPIAPPFSLPGDGYLLRENAAGWVDEERTAYATSGNDTPVKSDPVLSLLLDSSGNGWAVGGWSGDADSAGRGTSARNGGGRAVRERVRTAAVFRYGGGETAAGGGGTSRCRWRPGRCASRSPATPSATQLRRSLPAGDRPRPQPRRGLRTVAAMAGGAGPRALLYTGNRVKGGLGEEDAARYAGLVGSAPGLPVFPALGADDVGDGSGALAFESAFASFPAPLGAGPPAAGISTAGIPGAAPAPAPAPTTPSTAAAGGDGAGDRDRQLARLAGRQRPAPEPARGAAAVAEGGARRRSRQGDPDAGDGQPQPQRQLLAAAQRRRRRDRSRPGAGRRRRLRLPLRPARREPRDADPGRRGARRSRATGSGPSATARRSPAPSGSTSPTRCSATAASSSSSSTPPGAIRRPTGRRSRYG